MIKAIRGDNKVQIELIDKTHVNWGEIKKKKKKKKRKKKKRQTLLSSDG